MKIRQLFKKECLDCKEMFRPTGRSSKFCDDCRAIRLELRNAKLRLIDKSSWKKRWTNKSNIA